MSACSQPRSTARVSAASVRADSGRARKDSSTVRGPGTGLVYQPPPVRDEAILRNAIDLCLPVALTGCVPVGWARRPAASSDVAHLIRAQPAACADVCGQDSV